jgi:hypothetical protein
MEGVHRQSQIEGLLSGEIHFAALEYLPAYLPTDFFKLQLFIFSHS